MDRKLIEEKLESLRRTLARVESKCPESDKALAGDADLQDIIVVNLTRVVQICVDVASHVIADSNEQPPETMGAVFDALVSVGVLSPEIAVRMKKAVGFRNIAVHNYRTLDWKIVHAICRSGLGDFAEFAKAVSRRL
jgi:uncharacterized protein YutE (UPF0331/DUF86 family)